MKKYILFLALMAMSVALYAVPAKRGFHEFTLQDGTPVSLQLVGDEFAHWYESADGTIYRQNADGTFAPSASTRAEFDKRRKASPKFQTAQRRARAEFGKTPNLAPKGVVILVNFNDSKMRDTHTQATFNELVNAVECTVNSGYPSAREYFKSQSNGTYAPQFDVFGPVTLSKGYSYYGKNVDDEDEYATDAVIEACIMADSEYSNLNFSDYDSDNDGKVDFVYVIYAGKGEADGGNENTIWPHNWSIQELVTKYPGYTNYSKADTKLDNVYLDNYAMSSELEGSGTLGGIGTLCHEFGHVMGLPDFYETSYGNNYKNALTPNDWDIMDGGSYNGDGHCPPNYSPWEKCFFGWHTPVNLGNEAQLLELKANGTEGYQAYQITANGKAIDATTSGECYYIENRQQTGWDAGLPSHGMLVWKVNYNASAWENNAPNNDGTKGSPLYTIVSASGTKIGTHINNSRTSYIYDGPKNPFPGSAKVTSTTIAGKPLLNIAENNKVITLTYIEEPSTPVDPFEIIWQADGEEFARTTSEGKVVMPLEDPETCGNGRVFVGWCKTADYSNQTTAPTLIGEGQKAAEGDIYYAVYATKKEGGNEQVSTTYTFTSKSWNDETNSWQSIQDGDKFDSMKDGIQVTAAASGAGAKTKEALNNVSKVVIDYCTNAKTGAGNISVTIGNVDIVENVTKTGGVSLRQLDYSFDNVSGNVSFVVNTSANSIYVHSVTITAGGGVSYSDYATTCSGIQSAIENTRVDEPSATKVIRDGRVLIIRGDEEYTILGVKN